MDCVLMGPALGVDGALQCCVVVTATRVLVVGHADRSLSSLKRADRHWYWRLHCNVLPGCCDVACPRRRVRADGRHQVRFRIVLPPADAFQRGVPAAVAARRAAASDAVFHAFPIVFCCFACLIPRLLGAGLAGGGAARLQVEV